MHALTPSVGAAFGVAEIVVYVCVAKSNDNLCKWFYGNFEIRLASCVLGGLTCAGGRVCVCMEGTGCGCVSSMELKQLN